MNAKTPLEIIEEVARVRGNYSLPSFNRHKAALGIKPIGVRQRPQRYPAETSTLILAHLGMAASQTAPATGLAKPAKVRRPRLLTVGQLKETRRLHGVTINGKFEPVGGPVVKSLRAVPSSALRKPALAPRGKVRR